MIDLAAIDPRLVDRCRFPERPGAFRCGVSGGADSMAMLALASVVGGRDGRDVVAVHIDHGIRDDSAEDLEVVRSGADRLGVTVESLRLDVDDGPNLEARARDARHAALGPDVLLGHTADDRAEWVLLALMRGSGIDGLAAMDPRRRPILGLRRSETLDLCHQLGLETVDDPHNHESRFLRVRVRRELIPLLDDIAGRDVVPLLDRLAELSGDDVAVLEELASAIDPTDARAVAAAEPALARRAVRRWLRGAHPIDAAATDRVLAVARGEVVATEIAGGVTIRRSGQRLSIVEPEV